MHTMQKQGKWVGGKIALGYKKDPTDKNKLVICEEEAKIVKLIFDMAKTGVTISTIKNYLNENNIPTASKIRYNRPTFWENKSIKLILSNEIYTGVTVQNKRSRINYKNRKLKPNPKEQWIIVENTHTAIIDKKTFDNVQKMEITQKYNRNEKKYHFLLDGLLICYECKHKIGIKKDRNGRLGMVCNNYRKNSKLNICTSHGFSYDKLEDAILKYIKNLFLDIDNKKIELKIKNSETKYDYEKMLKKLMLEINLINNNIDKMYIDKLNNKISEEMYERLFNKLIIEEQQKVKEYNEIRNKEKEVGQDNNKEIEKIVKEFLKLENPTPELMKVIINRIEIHQDKQIDIIFNFTKSNEIHNNN